jgi:putative transposase
MKGRRYATGDKIRILREADRGEKSIADICLDDNLPVVSFHRWKRQFGRMDINEARRLKELERENSELRKMAGSMREADFVNRRFFLAAFTRPDKGG